MAESSQQSPAAETCASCGRSTRPEAVICTRCARRLFASDPILGGGPAGLDRAWSSAPYEGVARDLVAALKFRHLRPVADLMAERIEWLAPAHMLSGTVVPVPAPRPRGRGAALDPAAQIATSLAQRIGSDLEPCLERGKNDRTVGTNSSRRAHPPRIRAATTVPRSVLLIDDVLLTGASLTACARALRAAGASRVVTITFARQRQAEPSKED